MGALLSLASTKSEYGEVSQNENCKRQKMSSSLIIEGSRLIPSLPDEISIQILARLPRICYFNVRLVSKNWKATVMSHELFNLRKELRVTEEWLYVLTKAEDDKLFWHALDPLSRKWHRLPPMLSLATEEESEKSIFGIWRRNMVGPSNKIADVIWGWLGRKDAMDQMPFCGCAIGAIDRCLYVLGGFSRASAMRCVWRFDPILNVWNEVTPMSTGRAYCKTAVLNNKLYVVGGVSRGAGGLTPLQSAEVFDPCRDTWAQVPSMPFSRAQVLPTAFLADMLKPIATGMTSYRGKLCVPQSLYSWPFFVDVGGEIYDPETNSWVEMPMGMGEGWPARQAGTKLSVVVDGELYAFDPSSSLDSGKIKVYDQSDDAWKVVIGKVPLCDLSDTSESPYLLAGFHGKLHVITKDANHDIAVLQADLRDSSCSSRSNSSSPAGPLHECFDSLAETETVVWKAIATRDFGSSELVNCQVLDI
ncbi:F-box/kelch-repeat protein At1g22040 [Malania oleifera]|uniref:F-box/kelch-repeat protein At1g22040 n=1 Tax=Malania oleifera TaxID=397392 RepID=UPI0025AEC7C1|nr:F-box/kelch-repeat protein At1g22040 [Malania oleifera]